MRIRAGVTNEASSSPFELITTVTLYVFKLVPGCYPTDIYRSLPTDHRARQDQCSQQSNLKFEDVV